MPLIEEREAQAGLVAMPGRLPEQQQPERPGFFSQTLPAAFRLDNTVASLDQRAAEPEGDPWDPDFDPFDNLGEFAPFADSFAYASSRADVERVKARIRRELDDRATLAAATGFESFAAQLAAGVIDPVSLIPFGGAAVKATRLGNALAGGLATARAGLLGTTAAETVLQITQETRTLEESAANVAAGTLLAGILGGAIGAVAKPWPELEAGFARDLDIPAPERLDPLEPNSVVLTADDLTRDTSGEAFARAAAAEPTDSTAGAAQAWRPVAEERLASALGIEDTAVMRLTPMMRTAVSPSVETRRWAQELVETPFRYEKNEIGAASPVAVETRVKMWNAPLADALDGLDRIFVRYRTNKAQPGIAPVTRIELGDLGAAGLRRLGMGAPARKLTRKQFREAVGRAMRRGDQDPIPEVAEAAQMLRRTVFEPLKQRAIKAGLLPEDVTVDTAASYFTRVYNAEKIKARRPEFVGIVQKWLREQATSASQRLDEAGTLAGRMQPQLDELRTKLREAQANLADLRRRLSSRRGDRDRLARDLRTARRQAEAAERGTPAFAEFMRDVRRGRPAGKPPLRLTSWLAQKGIRDDGGELRAIGITPTSRPGLINNKSGRGLDDAARAAWEEGYIGRLDDRPDIDELLEALRADTQLGRPVYRDADLDWVLRQEEIDAFRQELDKAGLDPARLSDAELEAEIATRTGGDVTEAELRQAEIDAALVTDRRARARARVSELEGTLRGARDDVARLRTDRDLARTDVTTYEVGLSDTQAAVDRARRTIAEAEAFGRADDAELLDIAEQITDRVMAAPDGRILYDPIPLARGPLKERTFSIPDELIEDFLESDAELVSRFYIRTMAPDTELAARFGRPDMADQITKVNEDYQRRMRATTDERVLRRLDAQRRADIRDLSAMRDRLRGTYAAPADPDGFFTRATNVASNWNYLRLMGQMTLSSIPDLARPVMREGVMRVVGDGVVPLVRSFRTFRMAADEVKQAGTALDMVLDTRAMSLWDVGDQYGRHTAFERGLAAASRKFGAATLMAPWNAALKQFAGVIVQARILDHATGLAEGSLSNAGRTRLAQAGISDEMARRIARQYAQHGENRNGTRLANTLAWTDRDALDTFRAAVVRDVDTTIVTPGIGARPLWMSTQTGRLVGQFKSFAFASTQNVTLAGLQQRDAAFLNGLLLSVGLGMVSYAVTGSIAGRDLSDDPRVWVAEGIDRSGVTGILMEANNITEKVTRGTVGVNALIGGPPMSRYASRGVLDALIGPTGGMVEDIARIGGAASTGEWTAADARALRRLLPAQNLFYARSVFDDAEAGLREALGIPEPPPKPDAPR